MKYILPVIFLIISTGCQRNHSSAPENKIQKSDLPRLKWLEGNWAGIYQGAPFYESYHFLNDSTIQIKLYSDVGTDTARTEYDSVYWKDGYFFMGSTPNYKVVSLKDKEVKMIPVGRTLNFITFTLVDDSTWTALIITPMDTVNYRMQKITTMDSLLSSIK